MHRAEVWWADLDPPHGSGPGGTRPVVIVQANRFTHSRMSTVIVVALTTNLRLADAPGNVLLLAGSAGLHRDSVANVTQMLAVDKSRLTERVGQLDAIKTAELDRGLRLVLGL